MTRSFKSLEGGDDQVATNLPSQWTSRGGSREIAGELYDFIKGQFIFLKIMEQAVFHKILTHFLLFTGLLVSAFSVFFWCIVGVRKMSPVTTNQP